MLIDRKIKDFLTKSRKSVLLLGPRQTGKSTLVQELTPELSINLADEETFVQFLRDPGLLKRQIGRSKTVFIDEIQRIPSMLNTVQSLVDKDKSLKFYLTGSSARKLRRGKANLLPGRVFVYHLGPLAPSELKNAFDLDKALSLGLLPEPFLGEIRTDAEKLLKSYSVTYLKEEIQAEALTRNLEGFSRFFEVAASRNGDFIDFSKFSSQSYIERTSACRYFDILCDTLVVEKVEAFSKSSKRRLIQHPRYYFFDVGVLNGVLNNFAVSADRKGMLFENLFLQCVLSEFRALDQEARISVYRTEHGAEVDFVIEIGKKIIAIEVKASKTIGNGDLKGLKSFQDYLGKSCECMVVYLGEHRQNFGGIAVLPFLSALEALKI